MPRLLRQEAFSYITNFQQRTDYCLEKILELFGIKRSTFYDWQKATEIQPEKKIVRSAASVRADEVAAVLAYRDLQPDIGYRKFTWQMVDANIAYIVILAHIFNMRFCG